MLSESEARRYVIKSIMDATVVGSYLGECTMLNVAFSGYGGHVRTHTRLIVVSLMSAGILSGCASFSPDGGMGPAIHMAKNHLGKDLRQAKTPEEAQAISEAIRPLLAKPLAVEEAIQVALLNNPGLQATYAELGIADAERVQAGRLQNPGFSFKRLRQADDIMIERTFMFNLIHILTLPLSTRIEHQRFEQVKLQVANEVLHVATETRKAYFEAVAAQQSADYARQVSVAAEAGAELAHKMKQAGNWSALEQMQEEVFYTEARAGVVRANQAVVESREKLGRLMGLDATNNAFQLMERLPDLPARPLTLENAEAYGMAHRIDIQAGKQQVASLASSLGLSRSTRFINVLDLGLIRENETGQPVSKGVELSVEIPLFDWGQARVAKAEATYMQSAHRLSETALQARSQIRESYQGYQHAYELARHYHDKVVPLRKRISDEKLLRYNGMLISAFELLADAREQVASVTQAMEALKNYWIAESALQQALGGKLPVVTFQEGNSK